MSAYINIKKESELPDKLSVNKWYGQLFESLISANQRMIVSCQGQRDWCLSILPEEGAFSHTLVLSNQLDLGDRLQDLQIPFSKAETLLGQEADCVVYDGFSGINIDVFCMAAGLIKAGGILIFMLPESFNNVDDVYGQWQGKSSSQHYFFNYLLTQLNSDMLLLDDNNLTTFPELKKLPLSAVPKFIENMTLQQQQIFDQLKSWIKTKKHPVFVLTADRGRGKSTLLGRFAQQLSNDLQIEITAASKAQVSILFKQIQGHRHNIHFSSPDEIIRRNRAVDLLIIDEAAMLPNTMLEQCIALSNKTLIATTTGGYEGTGQGFLIKFLASLDASKIIHRKLDEAIRWGQQDQMEKWIDKALMLKPVEFKQTVEPDSLSIEWLSKQQLNEDLKTLKAVYALLVSAHYRTRPSDLRQLMEDPNQRVLVAKSGQQVVAVLLLNEEGGFDEVMCHEVFMGKRRPQGHLLAQMITAQAGVKNFAGFKGLRVQRIAVDESCRRMGIGRRLLEAAEKLVTERKLDYLGSSFALDSAVAVFWHKMGFELVHISSGKGKSTGRQTVAVLKSENVQVKQAVTVLKQKINNYLPVWLLSYCQSMVWSDVYALLELLTVNVTLSKLDEDEIVSFCEGFRGFDLAQATLQKLLIRQLLTAELTTAELKILIEKILLNKGWDELSDQDSLNQGKKKILKQLRLTVAKLN